MSDAPILAPMNLVTNLDAAGDFEKKHTPHIGLETIESKTRIWVKAGHHVPHPNTPDHYFQWIEVLADGNAIARFDLSPVATEPHVCVHVDLPRGTVVRAVAYCNLHGLWAAELTL
ncbi:MAG: desulfoferrodoxin family protein [Coriobacteriia bacterium]|nr:desulfoferrodoxin family protein [Coriobacteriia bacterium]MDO9108245.1 desulfoferrodoxin family protein [Coriobacteriia bacterium]